MNSRKLAMTGIGVIAFSLIACSPKAAEPTPAAATPPAPAAAAPMAGMDMSTPAQPSAAPITATGAITAIDAKAGAVTLKHEPIPAVNWDAMTMQFTADPAILTGLAVGDAVTFELKSAAEKSTIVKIQKQ
jgi:Cu(I)/Ag(I) efflux system periplasmic protein CusF